MTADERLAALIDTAARLLDAADDLADVLDIDDADTDARSATLRDELRDRAGLR